VDRPPMPTATAARPPAALKQCGVIVQVPWYYKGKNEVPLHIRATPYTIRYHYRYITGDNTPRMKIENLMRESSDASREKELNI